MKRFRLTSPKPKITENHVEQACRALLAYRGYKVIRQQSGLLKTPDGRWIRVGEPGLPDYSALHASYPGFLLEVKRPGADLADVQREKIREIELGYHLAVAVIADVNELADWLNDHERKARGP